MSLASQSRTRAAIRKAVRRYAAERKATGLHRDTVDVTLATGAKAVALIVIDLVPDPTQEP